jgi:hypothetical protein
LGALKSLECLPLVKITNSHLFVENHKKSTLSQYLSLIPENKPYISSQTTQTQFLGHSGKAANQTAFKI